MELHGVNSHQIWRTSSDNTVRESAGLELDCAQETTFHNSADRGAPCSTLAPTNPVFNFQCADGLGGLVKTLA